MTCDVERADIGLWASGVGHWALDIGRWTCGHADTLDVLDIGRRTFEVACWTLGRWDVGTLDGGNESLDVIMVDIGVRCTLNTLDVGSCTHNTLNV